MVYSSESNDNSECPSDLDLVQSVIDLILTSQSMHDLCMRFVHDSFAEGMIEGAHVYNISETLDIVHQVGYGRTPSEFELSTSAWDSTSPLAQCVKKKIPIFDSGKDPTNLAVPFLLERVPNACLLLFLNDSVRENPLSQVTFKTLSKLGAFFFDVMPIKSTKKNVTRQNIGQQKLSNRQIEILRLISLGLKNADIGKKISISESTVRQETIRIYRELGAYGRSEAVHKAKLLSLI